jgi:hypothetical protein
MKITIKPISLIDVLDFSDKYNVNNLYTLRPIDYETVCKQNNTKYWIDLFHKDNYKLISITNKYHINWIKEAYNLGQMTRKFSSLYLEDLEYLCKQFVNFDKDYFIRTDHVSLKDGIHGVGPYNNIKQVIESICTCTTNHYPIHKDDIILNIYLMEWKVFDKDNEFRVFVYNNHITAISLQFLYTKNKLFSKKSNEEINTLVININDFFNNNIKDKLYSMVNYTFDLVLLNDGTFYFIEPNSFGKDYSAGSALFHWINDSDILLNENCNEIEFRYTI